MLGPKGPTVAAKGCSPQQEVEKAARRGAIFLVLSKRAAIRMFSIALNQIVPAMWSVDPYYLLNCEIEKQNCDHFEISDMKMYGASKNFLMLEFFLAEM